MLIYNITSFFRISVRNGGEKGDEKKKNFPDVEYEVYRFTYLVQVFFLPY